MPSFSKAVFASVLSVALCSLAPAQLPLTQALPTPTQPAAPTDPLNRTTPSGAALGFLQAAQNGDNAIAALYLQMSAARRQSEGEEMAVELKYVMDHVFTGSLRNLSTQPEGVPQEGVPLGQQKLGTMAAGDVEVDLNLVRVSDPNAGKIWLISSETLAKVPELYDQAEARQVEHKLPNFLVKHQLFGMPVWQWLGLLLALVLAIPIGWVLLAVLEIPLRLWARHRGDLDWANWRSVSPPAWLLAATLVYRILVSYLGLPLLARHYDFQVTSVAVIIGGMWILWRIVRWSMRHVRNRALARGHVGTGSLMLLGERIIKAVIVIAAAFAVLGDLGFNMTTALAGVGIGTLAIGLGAQKTIENLFGGVSVLGDEVIRVGDVCRFGDRAGTVEDIGLRSTQIRTEERTLVAIPNGTVASINVENFNRRDKILFKTTLGLRPEMKADHLRCVLAELRRLLYSHPKVEQDSVRVRLTDIAGTSHTVEVFSYILTRDYNDFAAVREDLLLRMMDIVDEAGTSLAAPSQTLYLSRDSGLEKEKADSAVKKVADLREVKQLPFPDYHEKDISAFKGSIAYPQPESAVRKDQDEPGKGR
jgi:MscS family membrane protein